jgi:peptidoglycan-N-acetylglucosamine deacetylase
MKEIALTFDDGPNPPYTDQILDILKKNCIKAAFAVCGQNIQRHPEMGYHLMEIVHVQWEPYQ